MKELNLQVPCIDTAVSTYEKSCLLGTVCSDRGAVWVAKHKPSGTRYAIKIYDLEKCEEEWEWIKEEIILVRKLNHRNILNYLATFSCGHQLWSIMPLISYTSASRLVSSHFSTGLSENALLLIIKDVLQGLRYLHSRGIIHRSIRGSHILIDGSGRSLLCGLRHSISSISVGKWEKALYSYPAEAAFNLNWASPELLRQDMDGYSHKTDMYSLGITMCELGNGEVPYCRYEPQLMLVEKLYSREPFLIDTNTCHYITENGKDSGVGASYGDYLASLPKIIEKYFSPAAHQFVSLCLSFDPNSRPSADGLLHHAFIKQARKLDLILPDLLHPVTPIQDDTDLGETEADPLERYIERTCIEDEITWDL